MKFLTVIATIATIQVSHALDIDNFTLNTNDRFTNDATFIGAGLDFSGVGRADSGRWATMIGDNYFISANHFIPSGTVTFVSPSGTNFQYTVAGGSRVGSTDLWIGHFNESVDSSIARYDMTTTAAIDLAGTGVGGDTLLFSGNGSSSGGPFNHVVGENRAEYFFDDNVSGNGTFDVLGFAQNIADDDFGGPPHNDAKLFHEAQLQSGDSGSPLFSVSGSTLTIEGVAWAVATIGVDGEGNPTGIVDDFDQQSPGTEERNGSFYNYVGSYETEINNVIATIPTPVPEPTSLLYAVLSLPLLMLRRRSS